MSHSKLLQPYKQGCQLSCSPGWCVMCLGCGVSPRGSSSNYKQSAVPDRERLWLCVCVCVCFLICVFAHVSVFWSAACLLLFFAVIRGIPLSFLSPTMHCSLYQAAQEVEKCWDVKTLHTFHYLLSSLFFSLPFTSLHTFNRQPWSSFTTWLVFCCLSTCF